MTILYKLLNDANFDNSGELLKNSVGIREGDYVIFNIRNYCVPVIIPISKIDVIEVESDKKPVAYARFGYKFHRSGVNIKAESTTTPRNLNTELVKSVYVNQSQIGKKLVFENDDHVKGRYLGYLSNGDIRYIPIGLLELPRPDGSKFIRCNEGDAI